MIVQNELAYCKQVKFDNFVLPNVKLPVVD